MRSVGIADLDELVLRCRSPEARSFIEEAVACYRAGAFKACIVATWTAVIYDYLDKLRELETGGDANVAKKLEEFEKLRQSGDIAGSLRFEQSWLTTARDEFEFLTPIESVDFERLRDDRNRCAHPAMRTSEEPYQPPAELARYHLRNSVDHLLAQEPVQGRAALEALDRQWRLASFPTTTGAAKALLMAGPLARPREALVRNAVILLLKQLLRESLSETQQEQRIAALSAILEMHRGTAESVLRDRLSDLVAGLDDEQFLNVILLASQLPGTWDCLASHLQERAEIILAQPIPDERAYIITAGLQLPELEDIALSQLPVVTDDTLVAVLSRDVHPSALDEAVGRFAAAKSFDSAGKMRRRLIRPYISYLSLDQTRQLLEAFVENSQVQGSHGTCALLVQVLEATGQYVDDLGDEWLNVVEAGAGRKLRGFAVLEAAVDSTIPWTYLTDEDG